MDVDTEEIEEGPSVSGERCCKKRFEVKKVSIDWKDLGI